MIRFISSKRDFYSMIQSKEDYKFYLKADEIALSINKSFPKIIFEYLINNVWAFQRLLRKTEYYTNCKKSLLWKPYVFWLRYRLIKKGRALSFDIHPNSFGPGLCIAHAGTIIVNGKARIGANCRIGNCVHIGVQGGNDGLAPIIGDNSHIGAGVVIVGGIKIADGIAIGANSYVDKSFLEPGITITGSPAKKISDKGSEGLHHRATEMIIAD